MCVCKLEITDIRKLAGATEDLDFRGGNGAQVDEGGQGRKMNTEAGGGRGREGTRRRTMTTKDI